MSSTVSQIISSATEPIVVFLTNACPYCTKVVAALSEAKLSFKAVDLNSDSGAELRKELRSTFKHSSVPAVFVRGEFIGGANDGPESWMGTLPLLKSGKLAEMIESNPKL
mmetsp:Transcript_28732/g.39706  ORF Transcript_28732/g.39706 Transcript_28732/m.39706 type:complete len:110 (+) Transcript_28732:77-406(+)